MKEKLLNTNWAEITDNINSFEQVNDKLARATTKAAEQANLPKYRGNCSELQNPRLIVGEKELLAQNRETNAN